MSKSTIEWTEQTWNPVRGCSPISPGCQHCYAERQGGRFCGPGRPFDGFIQIGKNGNAGPQWTGKVELIPHLLEIPMRRHIPTTYFVNSMSDLFHESLAYEDIDRVIGAAICAPWHTYQILTKRAKNLYDYTQSGCHHPRDTGPDRARYHLEENIWLGVSVEDRKRKDRIDWLRKTPAEVRFISFEPLLEDLGDLDLRGITLAIIGGESGPGARPCNIDWIRSIVTQCIAAGVLVFVKQLGAWPVEIVRRSYRQRSGVLERLELRDRKGGDMSEWPADLQNLRQLPKRLEFPLL